MIEKAFKGRVPKAKDWLDAFVDTQNNLSLRKQARLTLGKSTIPSGEAGMQGQPLEAPRLADQEGRPLAAPRFYSAYLRKTRRKQTKIMAECLRKRHRKVLLEASFCTLALDEAQGRKLVRFRCDLKQKPWRRRGILGVYDCTPKTMGEGEEDHALRAMNGLDAFITRFCTPLRKACLEPVCDQDLKDHLLKIVVVLSADGGPAERRALYVACERMFPNLLILIRDSAHALRIAMKESLHHDAVFGEIWEELFNKRHAVVPDLQNSEKLKALLVAAQKEGHVILGLPSGHQPLDVVIAEVMEALGVYPRNVFLLWWGNDLGQLGSCGHQI